MVVTLQSEISGGHGFFLLRCCLKALLRFVEYPHLSQKYLTILVIIINLLYTNKLFLSICIIFA